MIAEKTKPYVPVFSITIRREGVIKEDPSCDHHLYWPHKPERVLVIKKYRDAEVTEKFKEITAWLIKVLTSLSIIELDGKSR